MVAVILSNAQIKKNAVYSSEQVIHTLASPVDNSKLQYDGHIYVLVGWNPK